MLGFRNPSLTTGPSSPVKTPPVAKPSLSKNRNGRASYETSSESRVLFVPYHITSTTESPSQISISASFWIYPISHITKGAWYLLEVDLLIVDSSALSVTREKEGGGTSSLKQSNWNIKNVFIHSAKHLL
jgi:hypothetical protein